MARGAGAHVARALWKLGVEAPVRGAVVREELGGGEVVEGARALEVGGGDAFCGEGAARGQEADVVPAAARVVHLVEVGVVVRALLRTP